MYVYITAFSSCPQFIDTEGVIPGFELGPMLGLKSNITLTDIYRYTIPILHMHRHAHTNTKLSAFSLLFI